MKWGCHPSLILQKRICVNWIMCLAAIVVYKNAVEVWHSADLWVSRSFLSVEGTARVCGEAGTYFNKSHVRSTGLKIGEVIGLWQSACNEILAVLLNLRKILLRCDCLKTAWEWRDPRQCQPCTLRVNLWWKIKTFYLNIFCWNASGLY